MDINKASRKDLEEVGQIDGDRARYLIEQRERSGPFRSWEDVKRVPSYEDGMVERLQGAGFSVGEERARSEERGRASEGGRTEERGRTEEGDRGGEHRTRRGGERGGSTGGRSLNSVSASELEEAHMIDGERARRLVEYRERHGGFRNWDEVKNVSGFEDALVDRLKNSGFRVE